MFTKNQAFQSFIREKAGRSELGEVAAERGGREQRERGRPLPREPVGCGLVPREPDLPTAWATVLGYLHQTADPPVSQEAGQTGRRCLHWGH